MAKNTIGELLSRDLARRIEEVIKLDQRDEQTVHEEITEYVVTDRILEQFKTVLQAVADGPGDASEAVGVWVSGFFGSGKSSFAKILGYILENHKLLGTPAAELFMRGIQKQSPGHSDVKKITELIEFINARIPSHVLMFDVQLDRDVRSATEPIAEIMYTVLLRELDYATDYDVADLEIELEAEDRLKEFVEKCADLYRDDVKGPALPERMPATLEDISPEDYAVWRLVRKGAQKVQRASTVLHHLDSKTYPDENAWAQSLRSSEVTIRTLVDRTFELVARRIPGYAIAYIIDEVGQYVARSAEKIEDLRAVVEHFGQESKNRLLKNKAVAPTWVVVTSQEKLEEVVAAIDDKRVELAKLQDRFRYRIDMKQADIREVATRRVLPKTEEGEKLLRGRYDKTQGQLKTHTKPERSQVSFEVSEEEFVQFYPYLPHFIELSIDIVSGMRLHAGAPRHIGGSNRTIIKQAYEMLVSDRTKLAEAPVGELVTLDRIFDLVEGNLPSERQKDIHEVTQLWPDDPWPSRVAKAITLLEYVRTLPRTEKNISAVLYRSLDAGSPLEDVQRSIELLEDKQFIRWTEDGWKLQTAQEKNWIVERSGLNPTPKERNDIWEDSLRSIFEDPGLSRYTHRGRAFRIDVAWQGRTVAGGKGQIPVELNVAESPDRFQDMAKEIRNQSREEENTVFWVMSATDAIDDQVAELYRSQRMVAKYDQLRAQGKISPVESATLSSEKLTALRIKEHLKGLIVQAFREGRGYFRGVERAGSDMGKTAAEILKGMLDHAVPMLYPKLEMGTASIKGNEASEILKAANLSGLSTVFYETDEGLGLVVAENGKYVVNLQATIAKEILAYLQAEHEYGNKVTGRMLEDHFGGIGYGWDRDVVVLVMASMLRGGAVEVTYQGRKYRNHLEAQVRSVFTGTQAFRSASFAPREAISLQTLVDAARRYEELTGEEVDVDETSIARAFIELAKHEMDALLPVEAIVQANRIPAQETILEYRSMLRSILQGASDDVVRMLAGEGKTFSELRGRVAEIREACSEESLEMLNRARYSLTRMWPILSERGADEALLEQAQELGALLEDAEYYRNLPTMDRATEAIRSAYRDLYESKHTERAEIYQEAIDEVKGLPEWGALTATVAPSEDEALKSPALEGEVAEQIIAPLASRTGHDLEWDEDSLGCSHCQAGIPQMESDIAAVSVICRRVINRLQEAMDPEAQIKRIRVAEVVGDYQALESEEDIATALERLKEHLLKILASGARIILE
jgi:hypothetical protein